MLLTLTVQEPESPISRPLQENNLSSQLALGMSTVIILGLHWSGAKVATHLVQANVGKVVLIDADEKALIDAQHSLEPVIVSSRSKTQLTTNHVVFSAQTAEQLINDADIVIDCLQNWQQKLLASDVCMHLRKTLIHAGGAGMRFQLYAMRPGRSACLRCAFPMAGIDDVPLLPENATSLEPLESMVAAMQALESLKILSRLGVSQGNELLKFDGLSGEFEVIRGLDPRRDCPDCRPAR